jgi:hypothetical protein
MAETEKSTIVGRTITGIRRLTDEECEQIWGMPASISDIPLVIELDDGSELIPFADPEGNGAGTLFYFNAEGEGNILIPPQNE